MKKILSLLLFLALAPAYAGSGFQTTLGVSCAASGSSTQLRAASAERVELLVSNTSGVTVRIGAVSSGTPNLTSANSIQLLAGQSYSASAPTNFIGRIVCMSSDGSARTLEVVETRNQ